MKENQVHRAPGMPVEDLALHGQVVYTYCVLIGFVGLLEVFFLYFGDGFQGVVQTKV
jgi:hypothetical protein